MKNERTILMINMDDSITILKEEIAHGPMEPYVLDVEGINWN
jgi:hypothetical protein